MPFFSIIIPTYNRAEELKRSLESVLSQTFTDFEVIVVDDGSTDNTSATVRSFKDMRVHYIYHQNSERSATRNTGMKAAEGNYICFLDSDDTYLPEHLAVLKATIDDRSQPVAMFKTKVQVNALNAAVSLPHINTKEDAIKYIWYKGCQLNSVCIHKDIAAKILFPEKFFWFEDNHWALRVGINFPLHLIDEYTCTYAIQDTAPLLHKDYKKYEENCVACIRDLELQSGDVIKKVVGNNCFDVRVAELYLGFIVSGAIKNGQSALAKEYIRKAMKTTGNPRLLVKCVYYYMKALKASPFR
jgi:glycosyltransferase involved in cell wall biosynthesis